MTALWFVLGALALFFVASLTVLWRIEQPDHMSDRWLEDERRRGSR